MNEQDRDKYIAERFAKLPKKITVGSLTYEVRILNALNLTDTASAPLGFTDRNMGTITITVTGNLSQDTNTLWHELLHCVFWEMGMTQNLPEEEEPIVNLMSNGICAMMMRNPSLSTWFHAAWGGVNVGY